MADFRNKDAFLGEIFERKHAYEFLVFNDRAVCGHRFVP